nr:MAG TPA: hypothetical protein [Caudoviricetes sp.]
MRVKRILCKGCTAQSNPCPLLRQPAGRFEN